MDRVTGEDRTRRADRTVSGPLAAKGLDGALMLQAELQDLDEIKGLVTRGQQQGVLSFSEVADAVSEVDLDEAEVEELYGFLEKSEIELVEDIDESVIKAAEAERAEGAARRRRKQKGQIDLRPDMTTDSLQLFLKDIGKV